MTAVVAKRSAAPLIGLLTVVALAGAAPACRQPPEKTPEGTLGLLRASLTTGNPPTDRVADTRLYNESVVLREARNIELRNSIPLTARGLALQLQDVARQAEPREYFRGVPTLLRQGHCERIGDGAMPEFLRSVPEPMDSWPPPAMALQRSVARRMANVVVGDYRCDGGPSFGAAFTHPYPDDGTWRVAWIGPATRP